MPVFKPIVLKKFVARVLERYGASEGAARVTADAIVAADLRGHGTHGVSRLPKIVGGIKAGNCVPRAKPRVVSSKGAVALVDGRKGLGHAVAFEAMKLAMRKAARYGIGAVGVRNSNHFGIAGYYSEYAARHGFVGLMVCNSEPAVAAFGSKKKVFGTNPIAIAFPSAPLDGNEVVSIDMATSSITRGSLFEASRKLQRIPAGMALDARGNPTTDPSAALDGVILPLGGLTKGYKGAALAFAVDVLAGALTSAACGSRVSGSSTTASPCTKGDFAIAIDVEKFVSQSVFRKRVAALAREVKASGARVLYPGEKEFRKSREAARKGISLDEDLVGKLKQIGLSAGVVLKL